MLSSNKLFPVVVVLAVTTTAVTGDGCTLNLQTDIEPTREPLIIKQVNAGSNGQQFDIAWPRVKLNNQDKKFQGIVDVEEGKEIIFSCPGPRSNVVRGVRSQTGVAKCDGGQLKFSKDKVADKDSISCSTRVAVSSVKNTQQRCASKPADILPLEPLNEATKFSIGFQVTINGHDVFLQMSEVCHSIDDMWTYYVFHQLHGESLQGAVQCSGRKCFSKEPKKDGVYQGVNPEKAYSQDEQIKTLDNILGVGSGARYVTKDRVYLARGHLAPDADFIYYSGQMSTYYFINAAPQWQNFNNGDWKTIEYAVRRLAGQLKKTLNVWTGTQGIQELKDINNKMKSIYLVPWENKPSSEQKSRLPVPEYYWKLVQDPSRSLCTVVLGYNDVHTKQSPAPICQPISVPGWPTRQEPQGWFIYYCTYESFKRRAYYIPPIDCQDTLPIP